MDSNHAIWNAYRNEYRPAIYLVDAGGRVRHHQPGEFPGAGAQAFSFTFG